MINALRGATTVPSDIKEEIESRTLELYDGILQANKLKEKSIISIIISTTADITSYYPATALRKSGVKKPLFSCQEPQIESQQGIPLCIRMLLTVRGGKGQHIYLHDAKNLTANILEGQNENRD